MAEEVGHRQGGRVIYLDTHSALWLRSGEVDWITPKNRRAVADSELLISPMVLLETSYLHEIGRVKHPATEILADLILNVGVRVCTLPFGSVIQQSIEESWTRDAFDRIIVAQAKLRNAPLLTLDEDIHGHYDGAIR